MLHAQVAVAVIAVATGAVVAIAEAVAATGAVAAVIAEAAAAEDADYTFLYFNDI